MTHKDLQIQQLEARASAAPSLAEGQALLAEASRLRRTRAPLAIWLGQPLLRN